jgi:uncharacterized membrane protein
VSRPSGTPRRLEVRIGRLLGIATLVAVALLALGSGLLLLAGQSPLDPAPRFDPGRLIGDLAALRPSGLLWLGLVVVLVTPVARVLAALVGYLEDGERAMALISGLIVVVIAAGVAAGLAGV